MDTLGSDPETPQCPLFGREIIAASGLGCRHRSRKLEYVEPYSVILFILGVHREYATADDYEFAPLLSASIPRLRSPEDLTEAAPGTIFLALS